MKKATPQSKNPQQQQQQKSPAKASRGKRGAQKVADTGAQEAKPVKQQVAKNTQPKQTPQSNKQEKSKQGGQQQQQQQQQQQKQKQPQAGKKQQPQQAGKQQPQQAGKQQPQQAGKKQQPQQAGKKQQPQQAGKKQQQKAATTTRGGVSAQEAARTKLRIDLIIRSKYQNPDKEIPSQLESQLCQHLVDLEATNKELKTHLRDLGIVAAREIEITPNKKAIIIFVPFVQHSRWQKIQDRVTRELEKKFSGQEVIFVAQRKVVKLNQIKNNIPRDRHTTITSVHENLLNDIVYPTKIIGKRIRFRVGGKRILKVYLDPKDSKEIEARLSTYEIVYHKLTKKVVKFMFPRFTI